MSVAIQIASGLKNPAGLVRIPGQRILVEVPFEGERDLFYCRPSTFSLSTCIQL